MKFPRTLILSAFFILLTVSLHAAHIVGGDMFYECLGFKDGDPRSNIRVFRITLDLYRDCQAQRAANFDNPIHVTYFSGNGSPYTMDASNQKNIFLQSQPTFVDPPDYPCLIVPPNVCVEVGRYEWEIEVPISNESYHVVWQRCCRNRTITNIYNAGNVGATFAVEITPLAQQRCNSTPRFKAFPPTVVCVNEPLMIDGSATDVDGDNLVYEFCNPLIGGGQGRDPFGGCNNPTANPDPDCPPPYGIVNFRAPTYTASYPLQGNPRVTIDPVSGLITGVPQIQGQFVVGVCVKEYRAGVLLSETRRDFQFNVSTCDPNFIADLEKDAIGSNAQFILNECGNKTVQLVNRSTGAINDILWTIDFGDSLYTSTQWSPTINFPKGGSYQGSLIVNPGTDCTDTAYIEFNIVEEINADFEFDYDTCIAGPVNFTDFSVTKGSTIESWDWFLDGGFRDTVVNPKVQYEDPNDYVVRLIIQDEFGCRDTATKNIAWKPVPPLVVIEPNVEGGCYPLNVEFLNLSKPIDDSYLIQWDFGDGTTATGFSPQHTYPDTGLYTVNVKILSPFGCFTEREFINLIEVTHPPIADFLADPLETDIFDPEVQVMDISKYSLGREWQIGSGIYFDENLTHTFEDTGVYRIQLIAIDQHGCTDTLVKYVDVAPRNTLFFPNAFTPNRDGKNDVFVGTGLINGIKDYKMSIFNRWGTLVFESNDPTEGWNGSFQNSEERVEAGVYVFKVEYTMPRGERVNYKNMVTIVK